MRLILFVVAVLTLAASAGMAQDDDASAWIARARTATADARFDTARIDLERAEHAAAGDARYDRPLAAAREALRRARVDRLAATEPARPGWTHGLAVGLIGGAAVAAVSTLAFALLSNALGFGRPRTCFDCSGGDYDDALFGLAVASGVSTLALAAVAGWLLADGRTIERASFAPHFAIGATGASVGLRASF